MARKTATKGKTKGNAATKPAGMKSLANIGVTTPARSALLLPESYEDLTRWVTRSSDLVPGQRAVVAARIIRGIRRGNARNGAPKTTVQVELADGTCFTPVWMGDTKKFHEYLEEGAFIVLAGVATEWGGHKGMMNPRVVDSRWMGRCLPVYPTPHRTGQDTVKQHTRALYARLGVSGRAGAVDLTRRLGVLPAQRTGRISPREHEVLCVLATGATNAEIARRLGLSPHTVKQHTCSIYRKLGARNRAQAAMRIPAGTAQGGPGEGNVTGSSWTGSA